jgi:hypothetical protein
MAMLNNYSTCKLPSVSGHHYWVILAALGSSLYIILNYVDYRSFAHVMGSKRGHVPLCGLTSCFFTEDALLRSPWLPVNTTHEEIFHHLRTPRVITVVENRNKPSIPFPPAEVVYKRQDSLRRPFDNVVILMIDACSYTCLMKYYPKLYKFLLGFHHEVSQPKSHKMFRFTPSIVGPNSVPNQMALFGGADARFVDPWENANKSTTWLNEFYTSRGYSFGNGGVEPYTFGDHIRAVTGLKPDWEFPKHIFAKQSSNCSGSPEDDGCQIIELINKTSGDYLPLKSGSVRFDGGSGCNLYCYNGVDKSRLMLDSAKSVLASKGMLLESHLNSTMV